MSPFYVLCVTRCDVCCDVSCPPPQYRQKRAFSLYTTYILGRSSADTWMPQAKEFFEVGV